MAIDPDDLDVDEQVFFTAGWILDAPAWVPEAAVEAERAHQERVQAELDEEAARAVEPVGLDAIYPDRTLTPAEGLQRMFDRVAGETRREQYRARKRLELEGVHVERLPDPPKVPVAEVKARKAKARKAKVRKVTGARIPKPPRDPEPSLQEMQAVSDLAADREAVREAALRGEYD